MLSARRGATPLLRMLAVALPLLVAWLPARAAAVSCKTVATLSGSASWQDTATWQAGCRTFGPLPGDDVEVACTNGAACTLTNVPDLSTPLASFKCNGGLQTTIVSCCSLHCTRSFLALTPALS